MGGSTSEVIGGLDGFRRIVEAVGFECFEERRQESMIWVGRGTDDENGVKGCENRDVAVSLGGRGLGIRGG